MILSAEEPGMGSRASESGETNVSVREVREAAYRLLCASAVSPGVASRAASMVLFSEVHHGDGLLWLYRQLDLIQRGGADPHRLRLIREANGVSMIEAGETSALTAGPPALDLVCERAVSTGSWAAQLSGAHGLPLLREPAHRAAARGLLCGVLWTTAQEAGEKSGSRSVFAVPTPTGVQFVEHYSSSEELIDALDGLLQGNPDEADARFTSWREYVRELTGRSLTSCFDGIGTEAVIVCVRAEEVHEVTYADSDRATVRRESELFEEWRVACTHGVSVSSEVWGSVYSASREMLVPEGGESQS